MARDFRIDSIKGLLIILVVMGHVITSLDNVNIINHAVMGFIYIFHMPLFILLSGYLTKPPEQQAPRDMWRGVLNLMVIAVIFHLIYVFRVYALGGDYTKVLTAFPQGALWYLVSLAYWRILHYYSPRSLLRNPVLYLAIALVVSILCGLTHLGKLLSIQRTLNFYVFFLLGYYYRQGMLSRRWWQSNLLHGAVAVVLLPLIFWLYPHCGNVMNGADHYPIAGIPQKELILTCSIAMSLLVFNLVRDFKPLRLIGQESLFYYVYHYFIISDIIIYAVGHLHLPKTFPFVVLYTAVTLALLWILSKIPLFKWAIQPVFNKRD